MTETHPAPTLNALADGTYLASVTPGGYGSSTITFRMTADDIKHVCTFLRVVYRSWYDHGVFEGEGGHYVRQQPGDTNPGVSISASFHPWAPKTIVLTVWPDGEYEHYLTPDDTKAFHAALRAVTA